MRDGSAFVVVTMASVFIPFFENALVARQVQGEAHDPYLRYTLVVTLAPFSKRPVYALVVGDS